MNEKQIILIDFLKEKFSPLNYKIKPEYSTDDNDQRVIVVQEQLGQKEVFYGDTEPLYNYFLIVIYGLSIQECKETALQIGSLIGKQELFERHVEKDNKKIIEKWNLMFIQNMNPQFAEYKDIRRVGYNLSFQCVINKVFEKEEKNE